MIDCGAALTPGDAASLSDALERLHPLWLDEPCDLTSLTAIRKISEERVTPLGFGRSLTRPAEFQELLRSPECGGACASNAPTRKRSETGGRHGRATGLALVSDTQKRVTHYTAWARSGMSLPYEPGRREQAIAVWLRNLADSLRNTNGMTRAS